MKCNDIHERVIKQPSGTVGQLIDTLASEKDKLWPIEKWWPMILDRPLSVGAIGGHGSGFITYKVIEYQQSQRIVFEFSQNQNGPGGSSTLKGLTGHHGYEVIHHPEGCLLRHFLHVNLSGVMILEWWIKILWMHRALIGDSLDKAQYQMEGSIAKPAQWSMYAKYLHKKAGKLRGKVPGSQQHQL